MYIIDATHYLNDKGEIAAQREAGRRMAEFVLSVVAHASDFDRSEEIPGPACVKCPKRDGHTAETGIVGDRAIVWKCQSCGTQGRIANWEGTFWDLSSGMPPH